MRAGVLRHFVTIEELVPVQDAGTGVITEDWVVFQANVPAEVHPSSVREFVAADAEQSKATGWVRIRYVAGVKQSMRILHGDQVFNILGVLPDPKSGREYLTLPVSEVQSG